MEASDLRTAGEELYGRFWQTKLAKELKVDPSTVRRWNSGAVAVPGPVAVAIRCMLRLKALRDRGAA